MAALDRAGKCEAEARQYCIQVGEGVLGMEGVSCALEPTTPGLGYLSYSFTAKLTGNYKNYHLFVKVAVGPMSTCTCTPHTLCLWHQFHLREYTAYTWLHPNLKLCLSEAGMSPDLLSFLAACHHQPSTDDTKGPIVLEDLMVQGFTLPTSDNLTLEQCHLVVRALATYHALGAAFLERSGGSISDKLHQLFEMPPDWLESIGEELLKATCNGIETFIDYLERSGKDRATIEAGEGLRDFRRTEQELIEEWNQANFLTFVHGDSRANNFMFSHGEDGAEDQVKMVDLQVGTRFTPWYDLAYLFFTSVHQQVLTEHLTPLLTTYHTTLASTLASMHYSKEVPSLEEVREGTFSLGMMAMPAGMCLISLEPEATKELMDAKLEDTYKAAKILRNL